MKHIFITLILLFTIASNSQIINLKNDDGTIINGAYYKDVDNELDQFIGTYQLISNNGNDEMTIVFKKIIGFYLPPYSEDLLVGEIKFKKDGILYFNNLNKINENYTNKYDHDICGNSLIANQTRPVCSDCLDNQYRADLIFFGRNNNCGGRIVLKKYLENGQEKLKATFYFRCPGHIVGEPVNPDSLIPGGEYILTKVP